MLDKLTTELRNEKTMNLDEMNTIEILTAMNEEDHRVPQQIAQALPAIAPLVEETIKAMKQGGRLIYVGAGTSGRLGVLDAAECPPTFGVAPDRVIGLIAGGEKAFIEAKEGAEDDEGLGEADLKKIQLTVRDVVVGIAASGRTPYVIGALKYANQVGAVTGSLACNRGAAISRIATYPIEVETGSEVLTGSTRLKAGTAQKLVLNMISTTVMIGLGKAYKNLMVDLKPTNEKLRERSKRIIMEATDVEAAVAEKHLREAGGVVKVAIITILTGCSVDQAQMTLDRNGGFIRKAVHELN
ncbi:N-acetylmuramic acid 6-phosphate etherase [Halalkalibacterium halodurans]|jgi:N-acetylmuramic acid 6-phosphate etherase|uniref:N-acetylmuramic acid 6-phosphate etherase n=3 Tax=Halalkalibacterium halodurans TaxID=86665 RepID=MURQ_HALH5|nr:N-acetylmuramic acid 6-phosphate etherase [Halalkalibacterium halodurans]Q9K6Z9.1 RecName: Full=N-acetylmuramic acid 6-phosphate etherase; Short=MurNAc-6-P etherase; AltName: Full=N-acetylmuramic acid 6-phosphate hydrolase; AltName: Full=N-acetylmuramic acid 6-phosphate lyase [Halalkalibacterium halodurans C-125]MDY7224053.1 N-acetylmuramic acid 6-phosphate etherase [Halalkalibacterium halodurans]MDY7243338.1 N-acetylmuramic acid 6-phosphate etherase [Halalkalibacterium halodurans]MED4080202